tara:strand:- start:117 stop:479 length:363 start_codon:yes stop_codon:yes gene_type:complete
MTNISKAIKILTSATEKNEIPTTEELLVIHRILNQLLENLVDDEYSGEDVSSVEESSDDADSSDNDEDCGSCCSESSERRSYKKGPRAKGYALYIKNGGTRASWSKKSDKYKDTYYERKK